LARLAPILLVLALLGATATAFAVTEGLKLTPSPIRSTQVDKIFSPVCRCPTAAAQIGFRLRKADRMTLAIVDRSGRVVRTLVDGRRFNHGFHHFAWNGRDDAEAVVPDGVYKPRVHLAGQHRTILLPNPIAVDTKPPVAVLTVRRRAFTPGHGRIQAFYRLNEPAHPLLVVDGDVAVKGRFERSRGKLEWFGAGARPGPHRLALRAVDVAGNESQATRPVIVQVAYLDLVRHRIAATAGGVVAVRFGPLRTAHWLLGGRRGVARNGRLRIRAPQRPGSYTLFVVADGHGDRARVVVSP
jgi:hypothetical protein